MGHQRAFATLVMGRTVTAEDARLAGFVNQVVAPGDTEAEARKVARELYERIKIPPRFAAPEAQHTLSPDEIERAFLDANAWLAPEMMSVTCRSENLLDVRVCFSRDLLPRPCGANEEQRRLCRADKIGIPPVGGH
jgi:ribonuclease I